MLAAAPLLLVVSLAQVDPLALAPLYQQAWDARVKKHGADHPSVAQAARDYGLFLRSQKMMSIAAPMLRRALAIDEKTLGAKSRQVAEDLEHLASVLPPEQALPYLTRVANGAFPDLAAQSLGQLGDIEPDVKKSAELFRRALTKEEQARGPKHPAVAMRLIDLALKLPPKEAEPLLRRALMIQNGRTPDFAVTLNNLANVLFEQKRLAEAEVVARHSVDILTLLLGSGDSRTQTAVDNLAGVQRARMRVRKGLMP